MISVAGVLPIGAARFFLLILCALEASSFLQAQTTFREVSTSGGLSAHSIYQNERLQFTLTIQNKFQPRADAQKLFDASLHQLTLVALPDSYSLEKICIAPQSTPLPEKCQSGEEFAAHKYLLAETVASGQSVTVRGYLKPMPGILHMASSLTALLAWTATGPAPSNTPAPAARLVTLGENRVQSDSGWSRLTFEDVFKAVGIPVLLLLLGVFTSWRVSVLTSRRDDRAHRREAERTLRSETWKQMLPISHNYAAKFYLPLSLSAERFVDTLAGGDQILAFYYLLDCGKKMTATRNEIGGFYFKDLRGERLAADCWKLQRLSCLGKEDSLFYTTVREAIGQLEDVSSYDVFERTFADMSSGSLQYNDDAIERAWQLFQTWAGETNGKETTLSYMRGFFAVLDYESNRPYQYWYDIQPKMTVSESTEALLKGILKDNKVPQAEIDGYFDALIRPEKEVENT